MYILCEGTLPRVGGGERVWVFSPPLPTIPYLNEFDFYFGNQEISLNRAFSSSFLEYGETNNGEFVIPSGRKPRRKSI